MRNLSLIFTILLIFACVALAQDVPWFEVVENDQLGLTPVFAARWGCSVADIDRNGWPDVYNPKWHGSLESQIFMNDNGYFTEIMSNSPELIEAEVNGAWDRTPVMVDYDNDGDRDLMLGTAYNLFLFRNDNSVFTDVTDQMGIVSGIPGFVSTYGYEMSAWIDWDLDGDLDALVVQTNNPDYIFYRNDGDQFIDIAAEVGLTGMNEMGNMTDRGWHTGRIQWIDWDNDGDPDLSAGYKLFRNDNGYLNEVSESVGFLPYKEIRFCDWFDYDLDGDFDFILQGYEGHDEVWINEGGSFRDATHETGFDLFTKSHQACLNVGDLDNDADEDVFIQINDWTGDDIEALLLNDDYEGVRSFVDVGQFANLLKLGDRKGSGLIDYDMDGKLDIYIASVEFNSIVYHNEGTEIPNNWIGLDLWGIKSNKDALGSRVTLYAGGKQQVRYRRAATTWRLQDRPYVHFGIGQATHIDSVVIHWPAGNKQVLTDLAINQYHKIEESGGTSVQIADIQAPQTLSLAQNYPNPFNPVTTIRYSLAKQENVTLKIFNVRGEEISTLVAGENQQAGQYSVVWDSKDNNGHNVSSGIYVYQLQAGEHISSKKMTLLK